MSHFDFRGVSPPKAAIQLGISRGLCYKLIREGKIPAVRLGRRLVIPIESLKALLNASGAERSDFNAQAKAKSSKR